MKKLASIPFIDFIQQLPDTHRKTTVGELNKVVSKALPGKRSFGREHVEIINGYLTTAEHISMCAKDRHRSLKSLNRWKNSLNICTGSMTCMVTVQEGKTCTACRKMKNQPKHHNRRSEYGSIRMKQRAEERAAKEAEN